MTRTPVTIEDGLVNVVVVYKIDRLSRSLADFAKLPATEQVVMLDGRAKDSAGAIGLVQEAVYCCLAAPKVEGRLRRDGRRIEIADGQCVRSATTTW